MRVLAALLIVVSVGCDRQSSEGAPQTQNATPSKHTSTGSQDAPVWNAEPVVGSQPHVTQDVTSSSTSEHAAGFDLQIIDDQGNPIPAVSVEPISLSINYAKFQTDDQGRANIPWKPQPVRWVAISKTGYVDSDHIDVDQPKPIIITLLKSTE